MNVPAGDRYYSRAELGLLCLFAISLPLFEAPKNIFLGLFVLVWFARSIWQRRFGYLTFAWNAAFVALLAAAALSTLASRSTSVHLAPDWKEFGDIFSYLILGWICCRTRIAHQQRIVLIACLVLATLAGIGHGLWTMAHDAKRVALQLNSVGQTNHSALYAMGISGILLAVVVPRFPAFDARLRFVSAASVLALLASMIMFGSRGALIALFLAATLFMWPHQKRHQIRLRNFIVLCLCVCAVGLYFKRDMIEKTLINLSGEGSITAKRGETMHSAIETWRQSRLYGVGPGNLPLIGREQLASWVSARGETFEPARYTFNLHAHNLYFNTLAERGVLGLAALCLFGALWLARLLKPPATVDSDDAWTCWGIGLSGFVLVFVGGLFNTTLHHEHGMLAMLCLGLMVTGMPSNRTMPTDT